MGFFDIFKKKKAEPAIDPEVLRENFVSARRQNQNFCQRNYVEAEQIFTVFVGKNLELVKVGDMDATANELINEKNRYKAGDTVTVEVYRDSKTITLTVTLDEYTPE